MSSGEGLESWGEELANAMRKSEVSSHSCWIPHPLRLGMGTSGSGSGGDELEFILGHLSSLTTHLSLHAAAVSARLGIANCRIYLQLCDSALRGCFWVVFVHQLSKANSASLRLLRDPLCCLLPP